MLYACCSHMILLVEHIEPDQPFIPSVSSSVGHTNVLRLLVEDPHKYTDAKNAIGHLFRIARRMKVWFFEYISNVLLTPLFHDRLTVITEVPSSWKVLRKSSSSLTAVAVHPALVLCS